MVVPYTKYWQYEAGREISDRWHKALDAKFQDDSFGDFNRDKRIDKENSRRAEFVHRLSYNKAIGYINRREKLHVLNGSALNRKPTAKKPELSEIEKEQQELLNAYFEYKNTAGYGLQKHDKQHITKQEKQAEKTPGKHKLSERTKDKVREKMLSMYRACSGRNGFRAGNVNFTFCTLTFIAPVDDNTGMDLLNNFFTTLKKRYGKFNYIWVAERQENKNIHFHLLADCTFPIGYINSLWVKQQSDAGVRNYESEFELYEQYRTTFSNLHTEGKYHIVQEFLNPVDIKRVKTIDGISCYLTNYVTKNNFEFDCSVWHCSRTVSKLFTNAIVSYETFNKTGDQKLNQITSRATASRPARTYINKTYYGQHCVINTIYNKSKYRHYLNDMELINRYIMNLGNEENEDKEITREFILPHIEYSAERYRREFGEKINPAFINGLF